MSNIPVGGVQIRDLPESGTLQSEDKFVIDRSNETMSVPASLLSEKTNATVSDAFDSAKEYSAGDYCIYNDVLYKFTSAKEVGVWDGDVVEATTIGEEVSELNTNLSIINPYFDSMDDLLAFINSKKTNFIALYTGSTSVCNVLSDGASSVSCKGYIVKLSRDDYFDYLLQAGNNGCMIGRYDSGSVSTKSMT